MSEHGGPPLQLEVDGQQVEVPDDGASLLEVLRDRLGLRSAKDGCSPQGQCGCCTVLVDGAPRVSCVTPARRVVGRSVTTLDGLAPDVREQWAEAFTACGASQCGFCTPGIIVRLEALRAGGGDLADACTVEKALQAHLCRCTGWQTIVEAAAAWGTAGDGLQDRDRSAAERRAAIEGRCAQQVGPQVALGEGGFADDTAPPDALVAVVDEQGTWVVEPTLQAARQRAGKVQGRRSTLDAQPPLSIPDGDWACTMRTSWVEPAYLETDASWCAPGGSAADPLANGGAFGAKTMSPVAEVAQHLAQEHGAPVRALWSREDTVRSGHKRPPVAGGVRPDGSGILQIVRTRGAADAITAVAPTVQVHEVDIAGPPCANALRAAGWAEALVLQAGVAVAGDGAVGHAGAALKFGGRPGVEVLADDAVRVVGPDGSLAEARVAPDGTLHLRVEAGDVLDAVVLRSYCIGAAHQAVSWIRSEGLAVDAQGVVQDLTVRSFGVLRAVDTPAIEVEIAASTAAPVNGSDAVFVAVAAAIWRSLGCPSGLPATGAS